MHLYMSGTPRNDPYQTIENRLCTHRLFSMHAEYERPVLRWVDDLRNGILDAEDYLRAYPHHRDNIIKRDAARREMQKQYGHSEDYDMSEVLEHVCKTLKGRPYPKAILLDSGAFTAWNKGETTTVDDVKRKYTSFIEKAGDMFDEIWGVNLDVIPGEKGRDPTEDELKRAVEVSDINFEILVKEFGDIILPVYHQGESLDRLDGCVAQVDGKSNYICVSPRNDLPEGKRVDWSRDVHFEIKRRYSHIMTHGLATTGNRMVRTVPWYSGDSAAWVQHGGFGMIDIFHDEDHSFGRKAQPHYMNYFVSLDKVEFDLDGSFVSKTGERLNARSLGCHEDMKMGEVAEVLMQHVSDIDALPMVGGHIRDESKHFNRLGPEHRAFIKQRVERLGFPFESCRWDSRIRNLICMAEFVEFAEWAKDAPKDRAQVSLF
ncbi:queuine tRNA-ribosyltransferase [Dinoroseobacter phage vB_DshS-R5C]|uniref:Queuosine tRNA-ribosyltransferase n=1 Tax=Dinoroseobacter phage vB_DshS-R5C TaxID=1965368 RepID=A0A1V0DYC9_9CAUD|nr:queuine tRNA-ribosyltransferase [Dinoroseobacter phage vB_DshS-R5C]ARB06140.1 queuosine tRNA-ribosyltransferase [Dinoroseobacter phage vB_DshS-R5C]